MFDLAAFLDNLSTFVSFDTTVDGPREGFVAARRWIERYFVQDTVKVERIPCGPVTSLLVRPLGSARPRIMGDGHIEVVPGSPDQFRLVERNGWLYGRGAADMKTQVLVMMEALRQAIADGDHHDFWLLLTEDEEAGSRRGAQVALELLEERGHLPEVVLAPDGGHDFSYVEKEKGILQFEVTTPGRAAHASRPFLAYNAIDRLLRIHAALTDQFPNPRQDSQWSSSLSMTRIEAGDSLNRIPDEAKAGYDLRFTESNTVQSIEHQVRSVVEKLGAKMRVLASGPATYYPREAPVARSFLGLLEEVTGRSPRILHSAGASNGRLYVAKDPDVMVLMSSPCMSGSHGDEERIRTEAIPAYFELVRRTLALRG
ncbi:MAG: M20 family metallopeptidase [Myxococcales bacterium]|nr:M20 family metallopeptidase [Myxococcales bacterium]